MAKSELTLVAYLVASACAAASWMSLTRLLYLKTIITITSLNEDMIFAALCLMGLWQQNVYKMCTPLFSGKDAYFTSCGDLWQKKYLHTYCRTVTKIQVAACIHLVSGEFNSREDFGLYLNLTSHKSSRLSSIWNYMC